MSTPVGKTSLYRMHCGGIIFTNTIPERSTSISSISFASDPTSIPAISIVRTACTTASLDPWTHMSS